MNTLSHSKQTNQISSLSTAPTISHTKKNAAKNSTQDNCFGGYDLAGVYNRCAFSC